MRDVIPAVDRELLVQELSEDKFVRKTNKGGRDIYIITHQNASNVMRELGRLRELTFREAGGGTGEEVDIDKYDTAENSFKQLIVWDAADKEIVGGYRYMEGRRVSLDEYGAPISPTSKLFKFSDKFIKNYLQETIELGRSFVQPKYQPLNNLRKGIYSLDNLWDGLGSLMVDYPEIKYFFGKFTMYPSYDRYSRDVIHHFLHKYFPDNDELIVPYESFLSQYDYNELEKLFMASTYQENYKVMVKFVRKRGYNVPPLVNAYMNLSPTMRTFGTALNRSFGDVEETGILITIGDVYDGKIDRHVSNYK
ncbi:MAG: GNAT family N-acetyltransferase [Bacteroidota bacterium]|nr:GNAT family N-acetyltransferase [Bacteroidota bacterium]